MASSSVTRKFKLMNWTKTKTALASVVIVAVTGTIVVLTRKPAQEELQQTKIAIAIDRITQTNAGLPDPQILAKTFIFTAMIQKKIPAAANWCETLNTGNKLWPVTPTNTVFALNSQMAGRAYTKGIRGDTVVFFETLTPGWNQAGGLELLAKKTEGVAVALMDGRAMIVPAADVPKLRWAP
jgi:hypothetical protein